MCVVERGCFDVSLSPDRLVHVSFSEIDPIHHHRLFLCKVGGGREIPMRCCQCDDDYHDLYHRESPAVAGKRPARRDHSDDHDRRQRRRPDLSHVTKELNVLRGSGEKTRFWFVRRLGRHTPIQRSMAAGTLPHPTRSQFPCGRGRGHRPSNPPHYRTTDSNSTPTPPTHARGQELGTRMRYARRRAGFVPKT